MLLFISNLGLHRLSSIVSEQLEDIVLPDIDEKPVKGQGQGSGM